MKETLKEITRARNQLAATVLKFLLSAIVFFAIPYVFRSDGNAVDELTFKLAFSAGFLVLVSAILKGAELADMFITCNLIRKTMLAESNWIKDSHAFLHSLPWPSEWMTNAYTTHDRLCFILSKDSRFPRVLRVRISPGGSRNPGRITGLEVLIEEGSKIREKKHFDFAHYSSNIFAGSLLRMKDSTLHVHDYGIDLGCPFTEEEKKTLCENIKDFSAL